MSHATLLFTLYATVVLTFFQQLVARAYTTVENILARTFYPLVLTLTQSLCGSPIKEFSSPGRWAIESQHYFAMSHMIFITQPHKLLGNKPILVWKWFRVQRSFSSIHFYGASNKLQLPIKGVVEEFKATKVRKVMLLKDSTDTKVSQAGIQGKTGRKWSASQAVEDAESRLRRMKMYSGQ